MQRQSGGGGAVQHRMAWVLRPGLSSAPAWSDVRATGTLPRPRPALPSTAPATPGPAPQAARIRSPLPPPRPSPMPHDCRGAAEVLALLQQPRPHHPPGARELPGVHIVHGRWAGAYSMAGGLALTIWQVGWRLYGKGMEETGEAAGGEGLEGAGWSRVLGAGLLPGCEPFPGCRWSLCAGNGGGGGA